MSIRIYTKSASCRPEQIEEWLNEIAGHRDTVRIINIFSQRMESDSYGDYVAVVEERDRE